MIGQEPSYDWQEVADAGPRGDLEAHLGKWVICGPVSSVEIDESDHVVIRLKWAARRLPSGRTGSGFWVCYPEIKEVVFPNHIPFAVEDTLERGRRLRFGSNVSYLLYLDDAGGLDPSRVQGLDLSKLKKAKISA